MNTCRLMIPKAACEMAKNSARSHQVGRQKHSAKYLWQASHSVADWKSKSTLMCLMRQQ